ncbi:hypothetical protein [Actinoallomurus acaciae]|uniref:Uncharacterized protein n=1 Tax=Actinoallomurus acaciae TaxID=502577 RepID=A0ABV5YF23_9ACTN
MSEEPYTCEIYKEAAPRHHGLAEAVLDGDAERAAEHFAITDLRRLVARVGRDRP